jgi:hypothetical protein
MEQAEKKVLSLIRAIISLRSCNYLSAENAVYFLRVKIFANVSVEFV